MWQKSQQTKDREMYMRLNMMDVNHFLDLARTTEGYRMEYPLGWQDYSVVQKLSNRLDKGE